MEQKSNKKIWQTLFIVLGMLAFGVLGFYCGSQDTFHITNKKPKTHVKVDSREQTIDVSEEENDDISESDKELMQKMVDRLLGEISLRSIKEFYETGEITDTIKTIYVLKELEDKFVDDVDDEKCRLGYIKEEDVKDAYNNYFTGTMSTDASFPYSYEENKFYKGSCGGFTFNANLIKSKYTYDLRNDKYNIDFYLGFADMDYMNIYSDPAFENTMKSSKYENEYKDYILKEDEVTNYHHYSAVFVKNDDGKLVFDEFNLLK